MTRALRWGILGTGSIAAKFAGQLEQTPYGELVAVGSRSIESARQFTESFSATAHGSYEALVADPAVDAVYVSLPNAMHHDWSIRALRAGRHVLCEKPLATSAAEVEAMFDAAAGAGRLLVEAFMYRCQPAVDRLIREVRRGLIGEVKLIRTHFTFDRPAAADDIRYQAALGGGALWDVGCYCVHFARALTGQEPSHVQAIGHRHPLGVEDYAAGTLSFDASVLASFTCGMTLQGDRTSYVCGSEGYVAIDTPWFGCDEFTVVTERGQTRRTVHEPAPREVYALEAEAFARAAFAEAPPPIAPEDSLGNVRVLQQLRKAIQIP